MQKIVYRSEDKLREVRTLTMPVEVRAVANDEQHTGRMVEGYAALFNVFSPPSPIPADVSPQIPQGTTYRERILPDSLSWTEVAALFNHDENLQLAMYVADRPPEDNTLSLAVDEKGLKYSFLIDNTTDGQNLAVRLENKNVYRSSFGFFVTEDEWKVDEEGIITRDIKKAVVVDVSPVIFPFYPQTTVNIRGCEEYFRTKRLKEKLDILVKLQAKLATVGIFMNLKKDME